MPNRLPDIGDLVQIHGEDRRIWKIDGFTISLGEHREIARLVVPPGQEQWNREARNAARDDLILWVDEDTKEFP